MRLTSLHICQKLIFCIIVLTTADLSEAKYGGGSGTTEDPYTISNANHMQSIGADSNDWNKHFLMTEDIDLSAYTHTTFNIIGTGSDNAFKGVFDGNGYKIFNFTYSSSESDYIGIFGYVADPNAEIKNLGIIDPNINGGTGSVVGSLAGSLSAGVISGCYVDGGNILGNFDVGGLVGMNQESGILSDCYTLCDIYGGNQIGGLAGNNSGTIINCYAGGGVHGSSNAGGLTGLNSDGAVIASFWDIDTTGQTDSGGGEPRTTTEMMELNTFIIAGWDFTTPVWTMCECGVNYPRLIWGKSRIYYIDANTGNDNNSGLSNNTAFQSIQKGINKAEDCEIITVQPGIYYEDILFRGDPITLTSIDPTDPNIVKDTIIEGFVEFNGIENACCTLTGFKIFDTYIGAIYGNHTQATVSYCIISDSKGPNAKVVMDCDGIISNCLITNNSNCCGGMSTFAVFGSNGIIKNCTIANNDSGGVTSAFGDTMRIENCIIYNNTGPEVQVYDGSVIDISYCNLQGGLGEIEIIGSGDIIWGLGNMNSDPYFVDAPGGDYHLKSAGWRWDEYNSQWTYDAVTSRCIDAGNPGSSLGHEPLAVPGDPYNEEGINIRRNMGFFGGTVQASMCPLNWALLSDLNNDGNVDIVDLTEQAGGWLLSATEYPGDTNRDGVVNMDDIAILAADWLKTTEWID
jgi:hypothetical protein